VSPLSGAEAATLRKIRREAGAEGLDPCGLDLRHLNRLGRRGLTELLDPYRTPSGETRVRTAYAVCIGCPCPASCRDFRTCGVGS
jgi:hypothetical protein